MNISQVQSMHLGHQLSSHSFCSYAKHLFEDCADPMCFCYFFMSSTILLFTVPSAPTTTGITTVFICHILCISYSRYLFLLFFSISFRAMFLSDGTVISISLQMEFTGSLNTISGIFAVIVQSVLTGMSHMIVMLLSLLCITVSGSCWYHLSVVSIS